MKRPHYTEAKLFYDSPTAVEVGDYIQTPTGTSYCVTEVRRSKTQRFRKYLRVLRWPPDKIPPDATVHPLYWYARKPRPRQTLLRLPPPR